MAVQEEIREGKKGRKGKENKASSLPFLDHIIRNNKNEKGKEEMKEGKTHLSLALREEIKGGKRARKGRKSKASPPRAWPYRKK